MLKNEKLLTDSDKFYLSIKKGFPNMEEEENLEDLEESAENFSTLDEEIDFLDLD